MSADHRLIAYGTLAPGRPNHHQLGSLTGRWIAGTIRGDLVKEGWGADLGYPALILNPTSAPLEVQVLESPDLPAHWDRLDEFEGPGYRRVVTDVETEDGVLRASIYVLNPGLGGDRP